MARRKVVMENRHIRMETDGLDFDHIGPELARFARSELQNAIISGIASPIYDKWVNGRKDAEEETVVPPGPIYYEFSYWEPVIKFALGFLNRRSPVKSGRYQSSHVVMLGSQVISPDTQISADEEVTIVNTQPYSRKIEVGHMVMSMPDGVYQDARKTIASQFSGQIKVQFRMIYLPNGYVLKGIFRRGYKRFARTKLKRDTQAGARMTYPALVMTMAGR